MVAAGNSLALNQGIQEEQVVPARYRQEFLTIAWEQVHLRSIFSFQYFSIGASLIPFIEHNDANRALMSSNMQRQAVPLSQSEKCIVGTGLEGQAALDSGALAIAEHEGEIIYTDTDKILLSGNGDTLRIPLVMYQRSNKNTFMHQKPQAQRGKCIKKGQILAYGAATVGGELALGKNVLVAYMPWEGYNFEDAVLISERLVYEDIYTSFHIRDILVGKLTPQMVKESSYAPEDRLLRTILGMRKREIKVGDKVAGRHGNKGIISKILPRQDMPYLQDGRPVDMVFKPIRSTFPNESTKQTVNPWIFEPESPGKSRIFDGRTGDPFEQPVIIGKPYILKLIHQVDDKSMGVPVGIIHVLHNNPLKEGPRKGIMGRRNGARQEVLGTIIFGGRIPTPEDAPESFRLFVRELRSLALELNHFLVSEKTFQLNRKEA
ncbi:unnamed protein product [Lactuca saligna]|uniref:DNA-directed RNA polymerase n=1 Tax=Lactuca saligna TaxID=75948 RepID=A0AA35V6W3_LACSI|nr:unnamed protein product [Lactuca saligna]